MLCTGAGAGQRLLAEEAGRPHHYSEFLVLVQTRPASLQALCRKVIRRHFYSRKESQERKVRGEPCCSEGEAVLAGEREAGQVQHAAAGQLPQPPGRKIE